MREQYLRYVSIIFLLLTDICKCFLPTLNNRWQAQRPSFHKHNEAKTRTLSIIKSKKFENDNILERKGEYFDFDRFKGKVEFGTTADLITALPSPSIEGISSSSMIAKWIQDERRVALSIWDPNLIKELGKSKYRLQLMTLQFVTITLTPTVDVDMWTEDIDSKPVFYIESGAFDPNVQLLPGVSINSLDIQIKVVGTMQVSPDGKGLTGKIGFVSSGYLPPPLRLVPDSVMRKATEYINSTVKRFAIKSFQKGAVLEYRKFLRSEEMKMRISKKSD